MNAPPGFNLETMQGYADELQAYFLPFVDDEPGEYQRGETEVPAMAYINMGVTPQGIRIITQSKDPADIRDLMDALEQKYETYPGMRAFAARGSIISSNDGGTRSVNLDISGPDLASLYEVAQAAYSRAEDVFDDPRVQSQPSSLSLAQPLLQVKPNFDRAADVGMTTEDIGFAVAVLTDGAFVNEFFLEDDKIDMYLYNQQGPNATLETLDNIAVHTPAGETLLLSELVTIEETVDTSTVRRKDGRRTITLNIIPPRSVALETGVAIVREDVVGYLQESGQVPNGVTLTISGAADQLDATRDSLTDNYLVALVIVYLLMVAIFSHWGYPLLIMLTIPLGFAGGIAGLAVLNLIGEIMQALGLGSLSQPFDMISMLGFLILMGTVVNNPILIVDRSTRNVQEEGMNPVEAVREAVESRLRPIAISSITTICGLAPLVFLPGAGSELYRGVGVIVMAGIIGATLVTLTMLPALTVMVLNWQKRAGKLAT
jgi:multidrug efflux pump subunit AcrB